MKRPVDLVDPNSDLATLYSNEDSRFPLSNSEYSSNDILFILRQLGMSTEVISWEEIVARAHSIQHVDLNVAIGRTKVMVLIAMH